MTADRRGLLFGISAYGLWGLFPLYWPLLAPASAQEVLAERVLWSLVFVGGLILLTGRQSRTAAVLADRRRRRILASAAVVVAINWGTYIWGVDHHHVLETSLGYFVNPIVSVLLGVVVLGERLRSAQWAAVALAVVAVVVLGVDAGRPPWLALVLAFSFGAYGLLKKLVGVGALEGVTVETLTLAPAAALYLVIAGGGSFAAHGPGHAGLLALSGVATAVPLLLFAGAASRIPLYTLGVLQYLAPTLQFVIGVTIRHEPLSPGRIAGFGLVWVAVTVFSVDLVRGRRREVAELV